MLNSLLVANRGEIALRIFRTARRLGVRTVAVYSEADRGARHVADADEAICIGPEPPHQSYLNVQSILNAARVSRVAAVHPGYGFLSENSQFAQACLDAGFVFVGPTPAIIASMGSKLTAKARMRAAGVPTLPGYEGLRQDIDHLQAEGLALGSPVMIKPAAGGGGKGMRVVRTPAELRPALSAARRFAERNYGDGALLIERFLSTPRHVEVQVFGDTHGNLVHVGDRDCSVQRRHQKLIEEAPAPCLTQDIRQQLHAAALRVARELSYIGAGTVEFLLDGGNFYFMEMNTRLQVEHPVTEAISGLDLVEWQLRVASGQSLPLTQSQVRLTGHAIEARVCAEDPERNFMPCPGKVTEMSWPSGDSIRVDAGVYSGDQVPASYDSLLGKVIAWAPHRREATVRLAQALQRTACVGVQTNEQWLGRVLSAPDFQAVRHSIAWVEGLGAAAAGQMSP